MPACCNPAIRAPPKLFCKRSAYRPAGQSHAPNQTARRNSPLLPPNQQHLMPKQDSAALAATLTRLAQFKEPFLAISITKQADGFCGRVVARHEDKLLASFGNRLRKTLPELKEALCHYLTFEFRISVAKRNYIVGEIERLAHKAGAAPPGPD